MVFERQAPSADRLRPVSHRGKRLLVADDDEYTRHSLASALRLAGFVVDLCADGREVLDRIEPFEPDLIVLDVMPHLDGFEVCRQLRSAGTETPVIFLTARDRTDEKVLGLVEGGDDYVTKPFDLDELVARIDAVLKRTSPATATPRRHEYGDVTVDEDAHRVWVRDILVALSPTEFRLLRYLMFNAERVVSKAHILSHVWGYDSASDPGVVETYVFYLRRSCTVSGDGATDGKGLAVSSVSHRGFTHLGRDVSKEVDRGGADASLRSPSEHSPTPPRPRTTGFRLHTHVIVANSTPTPDDGTPLNCEHARVPGEGLEPPRRSGRPAGLSRDLDVCRVPYCAADLDFLRCARPARPPKSALLSKALARR
jgi:two-component system OmpR family response regulator